MEVTSLEGRGRPAGGAGRLAIHDALAVQVIGPTGRPLTGLAYTLTTADGTAVRGTLDEAGRLSLDTVAPGPATLTLERPDDGTDRVDADPVDAAGRTTVQTAARGDGAEATVHSGRDTLVQIDAPGMSDVSTSSAE